MKKGIKKNLKGLAVSTLALGLLTTPYGGVFAEGNQPTNVLSNEAFVKLKLMETTDVHGSLMDHDYYSDVPAKNGLVRVATAVSEERAENPNNLLFDNGDILQGNPFTDYLAKVDRPTFVNRLAGLDRYETAVQVSKQGWDSAETVIIVRGDDFADALAAAPLAYKYNAPILLTQTDSLNEDTKKEIKRLGATKAIVVGGKNVVSNRVTNALSAKLNLWVKRISGETRFDTAAAISNELGNPAKVVLVNGFNYPDAISAASYAAQNGFPILLTKTDEIPAATVEALNNVTDTILVGGTGVISEKVESAVNNPQRVGGKDRFETSLKLATELGSVKEKVFLSTGWGFADALTGSVLAAKEGAPVILVNKDKLPTAVEELVDSKYVTILGGENVVAESVVKGETNPIYDTMNLLDYDAATFGNHEFNYGLDFLMSSIKGAEFPFVSGNVYKADGDQDLSNNKNLVKPYKIIKKTVVDEAGKKQTLNVGVIGFVPPQIMQWDKANLEGKVVTEDIVASAKKWIPEMEADGADIIVTLAHTGFVNNPEDSENAVLGLSKVPGVDAILYGHSHLTFPTGKASDSIEGLTDSVKGTINGVAAVQAKVDGSHLGIIDLTLAKDKDGKWLVENSQSEVRSVADVKPNPELVESLADVHGKTVTYINSPVGETTAPINSYFSRVQDDPSVQIVNNAQKDYIEKKLVGTEYENLPVISAAAPFKAGRNGAGDFTNIPVGNVTIKNVADLYKYNNTVQAVLLSGSDLKNYLEWTTTNFNQIDPAKTEAQVLLNKDFPVYNFDIIDGVTYEVDVTQPSRYDAKGLEVANPDASRIVNLAYNGQPVTDDMQFVLATNNYRAGMGIVGGGKKIIYASPDENRQVVMNYIRDNKVINPSADNNWSIAPISGDVNVTFQSSPKAEEFAKETPNIKYLNKDEATGFANYSFNLSTVKVQLLGLNDLHGQLDTDTKVTRDGQSVLAGSMEYTAAAIRQREATNENTLLVNAGDMIGGSPLISALFQDEPTVEVMESLGMDVGTLGNHEFDEGIAELQRMINGGEHPQGKGTKGYDGMNFPVIAANAFDKSTGKLVTGTPYVVKEVGGQKIGFIGVITQETPDMIVTKGNENLQITDEAEAIDKYTAELKAQGIEAIVVLAHNPTNQDGYVDLYDATRIAETVNDEVDVIFAAHNHAFNDKVVDNKLIVQAYSYGSAFSDVDLELHPVTGEIIKKEAEVVTVYQANYTADPAVAAIMKKYEDEIAPMKAEVVGNSLTTLAKAYPSVATEFGDNGLGNLLADGMKAAMNSDFALMNGGGVRAQLDAGEVTFGDLFSIQPFGNVLNKTYLSGADLKEVLNKQITPKGLDFHISGFKYTYTWDNTAKTGQVVDLFLPNGEKLDPAKEYSVVLNNYMYGNASYGILPLASGLEVGPVDLDATLDFVKTLPVPFEYKQEGRIQKVTQ
ncbi:2',3'-cyclic-nucleotide 2'-phosphodiesterase/3'-nucleotidase/5'-nucleotidase [Bacillus niacini]|uniref:2',3'-cyclic-nucleotide 2'-phosphodiesterase/3'-nucleotidase/5'-nucleotidase n=1 Tax=Neobacillus niacini TaxID=86668 RepID=A0A852T5Y0_9BACI|nr:bifunctional 2',3'-cyclic-nucleotide 2'-phosphodiesterase/3'-nucleotidase [Neobacillus niacini]NYE03611.1 2',3'-cyclic-nucleotide 2'-phosphodiesterase/3'-nucleotidase/5'-nucleotidase [Neobacillus niacini]